MLPLSNTFFATLKVCEKCFLSCTFPFWIVNAVGILFIPVLIPKVICFFPRAPSLEKHKSPISGLVTSKYVEHKIKVTIIFLNSVEHYNIAYRECYIFMQSFHQRLLKCNFPFIG